MFKKLLLFAVNKLMDIVFIICRCRRSLEFGKDHSRRRLNRDHREVFRMRRVWMRFPGVLSKRKQREYLVVVSPVVFVSLRIVIFIFVFLYFFFDPNKNLFIISPSRCEFCKSKKKKHFFFLKFNRHKRLLFIYIYAFPSLCFRY